MTSVVDFSMLSEKGKELRIVGGFKFRFQKRLVHAAQKWVCCDKLCSAYLKLDARNDVFESRLVHNHNAKDANRLQVEKVCNAAKRRAVEDLCERPSKILHRELQNNPVVTNLSSADVTRIRNNVYHARSSERPELPKTLSALHAALDVYDRLQTSKKENFLLVNDSETNIVIIPFWEENSRGRNSRVGRDATPELGGTQLQN